jgi:hypothetical protein
MAKVKFRFWVKFDSGFDGILSIENVEGSGNTEILCPLLLHARGKKGADGSTRPPICAIFITLQGAKVLRSVRIHRPEVEEAVRLCFKELGPRHVLKSHQTDFAVIWPGDRWPDAIRYKIEDVPFIERNGLCPR